MNIKVVKQINQKTNSQSNDYEKENHLPNRAFDPDLASYETAAHVLWTGFSFLDSIPKKERFEEVCKVLRYADFAELESVTFQKGIDGEGLTFDEKTIGTLLKDNTLHALCHSAKVDHAYFLFNFNRRPALLIVEKTRGDVAVFYDFRLFERSTVLNFKKMIEEEYYAQTRKKFSVVDS